MKLLLYKDKSVRGTHMSPALVWIVKCDYWTDKWIDRQMLGNAIPVSCSGKAGNIKAGCIPFWTLWSISATITVVHLSHYVNIIKTT